MCQRLVNMCRTIHGHIESYSFVMQNISILASRHVSFSILLQENYLRSKKWNRNRLFCFSFIFIKGKAQHSKYLVTRCETQDFVKTASNDLWVAVSNIVYISSGFLLYVQGFKVGIYHRIVYSKTQCMQIQNNKTMAYLFQIKNG